MVFEVSSHYTPFKMGRDIKKNVRSNVIHKTPNLDYVIHGWPLRKHENFFSSDMYLFVKNRIFEGKE